MSTALQPSQLTAQSLTLVDRGGTIITPPTDGISLQQVGGSSVQVSPTGVQTPLGYLGAPNTDLNAFLGFAQSVLGNNFKFNRYAWEDNPAGIFDNFLENNSTSTIYETGVSVVNVTHGSGGVGTNKTFWRPFGSGLGLVSPVHAAGLLANQKIPTSLNPSNDRWAIFHSNYNAYQSNTATLTFICGLTSSETDPKTACVALATQNANLYLYTSLAGITNTINFGTVSAVGMSGITCDSQQIRVYHNGVQLGNPFSALQGVPSTNSFPFFGIDENGSSANAISYWDTILVANGGTL
jgi:hypothetical protein